MKEFLSYIKSIVPISIEEFAQIEILAKKVMLKKHEILVQEKARFNYEVFVIKGIMRAYIIDDEGNEKSTAFFNKDEFMSINALRTKNGYSRYTYQALKPCSLILFDSTEFHKLIAENGKLRQLAKVAKEKEQTRIAARDECLLQVRAIDKYLKFKQAYPFIENEISHKHIASYLGITPVSLSRIRKNMVVNN